MTATNQNLFDRAQRALPGGMLSPSRKLGHPYVFESAKGAILRDVEGNDHIDLHCGFGAILLGHGHAAVSDEVARVTAQHSLYGAGVSTLEIEAAETLVRILPCADQVAFCNSGSEATYHALRLARAATGRKRIIKFQGGYHGWHDYVAMNGQSKAEMIGRYDPLSAGMLAEAACLTANLPYNDAQAVSDFLTAHPGEVAAIIIEPVAHNMGAVAAQQSFLRELRALADAHGVVLIFDEVITGFRHALGGCQALSGVTPDLATFGKAAAGGYPIGILAGHRDLMRHVAVPGPEGVFMGGTFNGTPPALAAMLAVIREMERPGAYTALYAAGDYLRGGLSAIVDRLGLPVQVVGQGSVFLIYFFEGAFERYDDLLRNDTARDLAFRQGLIADRLIFQPLPMKRMYLSCAHDRPILDEVLTRFETGLTRLAKTPQSVTAPAN